MDIKITVDVRVSNSSVKFSKGMRKQLFNRACDDVLGDDCNNGHASVRSILDGTETMDEFFPKVEKYLDDWCDNGYFSRWTAFGNALYNDCCDVYNRLVDLYNDLL